MSKSALLCVPEDVLCSLTIPDCRVLMMARTCRGMRKLLTARTSPVHVTVRKKVLTDSRLARQFTCGMLHMQALFHIRHFECIGFYNNTRCVDLKFCEFEDLTFMHLHHFKMHHNQLREVHMINLLYILTFSRGLRTFQFTQQSMTCRHIPALAGAIRCFEKLEVLDLENNFLVFDSVGVVLDAVRSSTLSTLKLSTNCCEDAQKTMKLSRVIHSNCNCLRILELSFIRLRNKSVESLARAIGACPLLESLDLSRNHLHCDSLVQILTSTASCRRLQSFNWSGNRLGCAGTFLLTNHISNSEQWTSTMRVLKLRSCDIYSGMQQLTKALTVCMRLAVLDVSGNAVRAHEIGPLFTDMRLHSLDISSNYISDFGMQALLRLAKQNTTLKNFQVYGNHITRHSVSVLRKMKKTRQMTITVPLVVCPCDACQIA